MENNKILENIDDIYPMSDVEKGMIFVSLRDEENRPFYNENIIKYNEENYDIKLFQKALGLMVDKHEILRTSFSLYEYEKAVQIVHKSVAVDFVEYDIANKSEKQQDIYINEVREIEKKKFFLIKQGELLWRMRVFHRDKDNFSMLLVIHHAIIDGWSMALFFSELYDIYMKLKNSPRYTPNKLRCSYKQYVIEEMVAKKDEKVYEYWKKELSGYTRTDFSSLNIQKTDNGFERYKQYIGKDMLERLKETSIIQNTSIKNLCFSAFALSIQMITYESDIVLGIVNNNRPNCFDGEKLMGCFLNTNPVRVKVHQSYKYSEYIKEVDSKMIELIKYGKISLFEIARILGENPQQQNPIFDVLFNFVDFKILESVNDDTSDKKVNTEADVYGTNNTSLEFTVNSTFEKMNLFLTYDSSIFPLEIIKNISKYFLNILNSYISEPDSTIKKSNIMGYKEKSKILNVFNESSLDYPIGRTIGEVFESQVEKTPDNIALIFKEEKLTYREFNEKANIMARILRDEGVKPDSIVAIAMERSIEMMIGIMAIIKAGGAYLPIGNKLPVNRVNYMLEDSKVELILTEENFLDNATVRKGKILLYDDLNKSVCDDEYKKNLKNINSTEDLCYVIYTSGTTGNPKGVLIEHRSVSNRLEWMQRKYPLGEKDVILQKTPYTFDVSVWELFWWSFAGATVCVLEPNMEKDIEVITDTVKKHKVTTMHFVPSLFNVFIDYVKEQYKVSNLESLRCIFSSGEKLEPYMVNKFNDSLGKLNNTRLVNLYGPTEATVDVSFYECPVNKEVVEVPIGKPIDNLNLLIFDKNMQLQPIGVPGELCITGIGVARGYNNNINLTNEKFINNPVVNGCKMYRTGDLAKWREDGNIQFLGRIDSQVKIRGLRIELGEIEQELLKLDNVKEVVVSVKKNTDNDKYICAYIVSDEKVDNAVMKRYLKSNLPEYMIPSSFMNIERIPLTNNGKLDRNKLPEVKFDAMAAKYQLPQTEVEKKLLSIWIEVLGVEKIGIDDNFFEIGGHSLKATVLMSKIHKRFQKEVQLKKLFESPTIRKLAVIIEKENENLFSKIEKIAVKERYEASSAQKRMYVLQEFDRTSTAYNMPMVFEVSGVVNKEKIERIFNILTKRHEVLRTYFQTYENEIVQKIDDSYVLTVMERMENDPIEEVITGFTEPFNLNIAPLLRVELIEIKDKKYLLIDMHHIISDGVSMNILIKEFKNLYMGKQLETLRLQYKDFSAWQNRLIKSSKMMRQEEYWLGEFHDSIPILNMPTDYERPIVKSFKGSNISFEIDKDTTGKLRHIAGESGVTMHMVLLSAMYILLSKFSGQEDIVIGIPVAGRPHADIQNIIGLFVNTLALRAKPYGDKKCTEFIQEIKGKAIKAYENQSYQLESLIEKLDVIRDTSRNSMFDVMFNMAETADQYDIELDDLNFKLHQEQGDISKMDLTLNAIEGAETIKLCFEYCTKLFNRDTVQRLCNYYKNIVNEIISNSELTLAEIGWLSKEERSEILYKFNDTEMDYPKDKTVQELFEEQVIKTPEEIAAVFKDKRLTYYQLNSKANQLARVLRNKGVDRGSVVGILMERSVEVIIGILGILKSGAAYVPIDPNYPNERIEYMLSDSNTKLLITQRKLTRPDSENIEKIYLDDVNGLSGDTKNLEILNSAKSLAYIMYTSGSTGKPKGVLITHRSIANLCAWVSSTYELHKNKNVLQNTSISFDVSVEEIVPTLVSGGTLFITSETESVDRRKFREFILKNNISIVQVVPSTLQAFLLDGNKLESVNVLVSGGEVLADTLKDKILKLGYNLYNTYGPTEATVDITTIKCDVNRKVVIGKPVGNMKVFITSKYGEIQPIGVPGELCIGGDGLALGYLNKPELTDKKFICSPFEKNKRIYKSGDLAKWTADGNIEFLGRLDNQVKIKGVRIELEEIEKRILAFSIVKEAAVLVRGSVEKEKYLVAYVVCKETLNISLIKGYLKQYLPIYMIPQYFIDLESMPLTSNGKVNRKVLPEPDKVNLTGEEYVAPRNEIEKVLANIWGEVLNQEKLGINDNFFDLGGHSLKATVLLAKIHKELNKDIPLKELFKTPTIKGLGELVTKSEDIQYYQIEKVNEKDYYESSSAQKRMYMIQQIDKLSTAYNMPSAFELSGEVNFENIEESMNELIIRHEALRTSFDIIDDEIIQKIDEPDQVKIEMIELNEGIEESINNFIRPFDLKKAPLFRIGFVEGKGLKYLLFDMHHIISDGVSMEILIKEFSILYNKGLLKKEKFQYKDFAAWQNDFLKSEKIRKQEMYWVNRFNDEVPVLNLPTDYERPAMKSFDGESVQFMLNEDYTGKLDGLSKSTGATMHMILLSVFNILLSKYCRQDDIVVGAPIAGRTHNDIQNIMGIFVNTLPMRNQPHGDKEFTDFLEEVKENALKAYENQSYQFEVLIENLDLRRDSSRNPLFDVMFNMTEAVSDDIQLDGIGMKKCISKSRISKFDLTLNAIEIGNTLSFEIEYCSKLFKKETIERVSKHFIKVVDTVVCNKSIKISDIELITEEEKFQILNSFNQKQTEKVEEKTIYELFERQVQKTPNNVAIVFDNKKLTYNELNNKSNQLARKLREFGIERDQTVGIMVERSLEMIVAILGVLKSGGAYLPLDSKSPKERTEYMLEDSQCKMLLSTQKLVDNFDISCDTIDLFDDNLFKGDSLNLEKTNISNDLAYVIYTSGTTGNPKGVMIEHRNVVNLISALNERIYSKYSSNLNISLLAPMYFDASVKQIFVALLRGDTLFIAQDDVRSSGNGLMDFLKKNKIDVTDGTPVYLDMINNEINDYENTRLKHFIIGGDVLNTKQTEEIFKKFNQAEITNVYGPTECTVDTTSYKVIGNENNIPIGKPIKNSRVYIIDKYKKLLPWGLVGELCIAGEGVARGYINRSELTDAKFVDSPFELGEKMYMSGDLARWLPDGNIEFIGRVDNQVKIRGFRIELKEIENRLLQHDEIKEVVVTVKKDKDQEKHICAYVVSNQNIDDIGLKIYLAKSLPNYMVPTYFVQLNQMPLTHNGKLNRRELPEPKINRSLYEYEGPRDQIEESLVEIWTNVLKQEKIGINDNFFELGGHSLKATVVIANIHKVLGKEVPLKELFKTPTIKEIASYVKKSEDVEYLEIKKVDVSSPTYYDRSAVQSYEGDSIKYDEEIEHIGIEQEISEQIKEMEFNF